MQKLLSLSLIFLLCACQSRLDRISRIGNEPKMEELSMPEDKPTYTPIMWPHAKNDEKPNANSLWQPGSYSFFKDRKARQVGDILKVTVKVKDKAELDNKSTHTRGNTENVKAPTVLGLEKFATGWLPGKVSPASLVDLTGSNSHSGQGTIGRGETIETEVAAIVTQILPNGNLVINGDQEIRVNAELRKITVSGIVRPEDISADNAISSNQIAEARISYGGVGQISDVQQPRYGHQIIDAISPF